MNISQIEGDETMNRGVRAVIHGKGTATSRVVDALTQMLRSGRFRPGDRLPSEWELVQQLQIGRSAVREAVRELAAQDLMNRARRRELLEVRLIVEPGAASLAASRATRV